MPTTHSITGTAGNDILNGTRANDTIDGGAGIDAVVESGSYSQYQISKLGTSWVVKSNIAGTGTDTLKNVEYVRFADATLNLATGKLIPNAIAPSLIGATVSGNEDTAIALGIGASFVNTTSIETMSILITGMPAGAALSAGTLNNDGSWSLTQAQLSGLTVKPPHNSDTAFTLTIKAVVSDPITGTVASSTVSEAVKVVAVADMPTLTVAAASGVGNTAIPVSIAAALTDTDGSESLGIKVLGMPTGASLSAGTHNSDGSWTLTPAQLSGLTVSPPTNSAASFSLTVEAISTEAANGSTAMATATLAVTVTAPPPAPSTVTFTTSGGTTTATGTAGNDIINMTTVTTLTDTVNAGAGTDTVILPYAENWYKFSTDSQGHAVVQEAHATGQTTTMTGVEQLQFAGTPGQTFDVAGNLLGTAPAPSPAPSTVTFTTSGGTTTVTGTAGNDTI
ncbi:MAG: hypothetical protein WCF85_18625, partial [Rhodospirillaceae bacterium]